MNLVIVAPNWLGDAVMALPAVADVRRAAPDAEITVAARPAIAPLFELVPDVRVEKGPYPFFAEKGVRPLFDTALLLPNSFHAALVAYRAGIRERWGYRTEWRGPLLTRAIEPILGLHQVEYYQHLVHALGFPNGPLEPHVRISAELHDAGARALMTAGWDGRTPLVAIAPGAAYGGAKRWPARSFAELVDALASDGVRSVMIGSAADAQTGRDVGQAVARAIETRVGAPQQGALLDLIGRTDLPTLGGVLTHCRALVTNDSGAMHFAAAVGVSVTAMFGPTDESATRPIGDAHRIVTHPVWCRPCMLRECPIDHRCLRGIGVTAVLDAARRNL